MITSTTITMNESNNKPGGVAGDIMEKRTSETATEPLDLSDDEAIEALFAKKSKVSTKKKEDPPPTTTELPESKKADNEDGMATAGTNTKKKKKQTGGIKFGEVRVRERE